MQRTCSKVLDETKIYPRRSPRIKDSSQDSVLKREGELKSEEHDTVSHLSRLLIAVYSDALLVY
jgi:hypothetical protein